MRSIPILALRESIGRYFDEVRTTGKPIAITRNGKEIGQIIPPEPVKVLSIKEQGQLITEIEQDNIKLSESSKNLISKMHIQEESRSDKQQIIDYLD